MTSLTTTLTLPRTRANWYEYDSYNVLLRAKRRRESGRGKHWRVLERDGIIMILIMLYRRQTTTRRTTTLTFASTRVRWY